MHVQMKRRKVVMRVLRCRGWWKVSGALENRPIEQILLTPGGQGKRQSITRISAKGKGSGMGRPSFI